MLKRKVKRLTFEAGARYDLKNLNVATFSTTTPRTVERFAHVFHNYSFTAGTAYDNDRDFKANLNAGYVLRAPEVNELYSSGLHQGVSGIEEGSRDLVSEKSFKVVGSVDGSALNRFKYGATVYAQRIDDYIYLQPQEEFRLTIRGAFPVFKYEQTDALIAGADLNLQYAQSNWVWTGKYSFTRGRDIQNDAPLIYMPADNLFSSLKYKFQLSQKLKNVSVTLNGKYVFRQNRLLPEQDFLRTPDAYFLLGGEVSSTFSLKKSTLTFTLQAENLLNSRYRDYLNRLRYFADETGRNIRIGVRFGF